MENLFDLPRVFCLTVPIWGIGLLGTVFWIWVLIDCLINEPSEYRDKVVWVIIIVLTHFIGAAIYFFVRRPQRRAELGK
jgi:hypothetical protein